MQEDSSDSKILVTNLFEIEVPQNWKHKEKRGYDSFVGLIKGKDIKLNYDWSTMGYANSLVPSKDEFLQTQKNSWGLGGIPYGEVGVTYVMKESIESTRKEIMAKKGISDSTLVKVEELQIPENEILFEEGEYYLISKFRDTLTTTLITIPQEILEHNIMIDTIEHFRRKLIWPKENVSGTTGVYIEDLKSDFNFNLVGFNLSSKDQERVVKALKTLRIKEVEN
jgi:hypothetical protein